MNPMHQDIEEIIEFFAALPEPDKAYGKRAADLLKPFLENKDWSSFNTSNLCGAISKGILEWSCSDEVRILSEKKCDDLCNKAISLTVANKST